MYGGTNDAGYSLMGTYNSNNFDDYLESSSHIKQFMKLRLICIIFL